MFGFAQPEERRAELAENAAGATPSAAAAASGATRSRADLQPSQGPGEQKVTTAPVTSGSDSTQLASSSQRSNGPKQTQQHNKQQQQRRGALPAAERQGSGIDASDVRLANLRLIECIATRSKYGSVVQRLHTQAYPGELSTTLRGMSRRLDCELAVVLCFTSAASCCDCVGPSVHEHARISICIVRACS